MNTQEEWYYVSLCEQTQRYDEMFTKVVSVLHQNISQVEEHQLQSLALSYKNIIASKQAHLQVYRSSKVQQKYKFFLKIFQEQEINIEKQLYGIYESVLNLLEQVIANNDTKIIFECLSLKRTTYKYLIDVEKNEERRNFYIDQTNKETAKMHEIAKELAPIDPSRLRMALEMSTIYQKAGLIEKSYNTAKNAFDTALDALEELTKDEFAKNSKEISLVLNLLKDNMTLCSAPKFNE